MARTVPEEVAEAVEALRGIFKAHKGGRTNASIGAAAGFSKYPVDRLSSGSWVTKGLGLETMRQILKKLAVGAKDFEQAEAHWQTVEAWRRQVGLAAQKPSNDEPIRLVRYGRVLPDQPDRGYPSIDKVDITIWPDGRAEGEIRRIEPESLRNSRWNCSGVSRSGQLLITFWPAPARDDEPLTESIGQMSVQRETSLRRAWPGQIHKLERRTGEPPRPFTYQYWLCSADDERLASASSKVALLDFDNTLARGWILDSWMTELASAGIGQPDGLERLARLFAEYQARPGFGHDRLATQAAEIYAATLKDVRVSDLLPRADPFAVDYLGPKGALFASTRSLLDGLRARGLRTVLITGAPAELSKPIMRELGIERSFALQLKVDDGIYTGEILSNPGVSTGKAWVCEHLKQAEESEIAVAVGDSEGDRPMWREADVAIKVGGTPGEAEVHLSGVDLDRPIDEGLWEMVPAASWLAEIGGDQS